MRRKVWNLVCILGFTALACGIYLFVGNDINKSWAIVDEGSGVKGTAGATVGAKATSQCGSYYSYPPRCDDGYTTNKVAYGGRTCYTACTKKVVKTTSDFCVSGSAFVSFEAAETYCNRTGYTRTMRVGTTTSGKICATCSEKTKNCQSQYGEFDSLKEAANACDGADSVVSAKRTINGKSTTCYSCKEVLPSESQKCTPETLYNCDGKQDCELVGGKWDGLSCQKGEYQTYNDLCQSKGFYLYKQSCPENYESSKVGVIGYNFGYSCYTKCLPAREKEKSCEEIGLNSEKPTCKSGTASQEVDSARLTCYSDCVKPYDTKICEYNGLTSYKQICPTGTNSYEKVLDDITCYTSCEPPISKEYPECYLCNGKPVYGNYASVASCFPIGLSKQACLGSGDIDWRTRFYGGEEGTPWNDVPVIKISSEESFEENPKIYVFAESEGWSIYVTTSTDFPENIKYGWQGLPYNENVEMAKTVNLDESGTYYMYAKDAEGEIKLIGVKDVNEPANNTVKDLGVSGGTTSHNSYYGEALDIERAISGFDEYTVVSPQSMQSTNKTMFRTLSVNNNRYDIKFLGDSKIDKTLTVDPDTGLLLYALSEAEKTALGITTEKVYVVASKPEAKLSRSAYGVFTKDENGDVIAAGKNELGTIYRITPKNDISTMSEYIFYAINLTYIEDADYSDPNTWNDLKLLSYNSTTTADTDFTFEIVRNGMTDIVKQLSTTKEPYQIVQLASASTEDLGTFYINFDSDVTQYEFSIDDDQITLNPILVYTDSEYVEGYGPRTVDLEYGLNVEYIKVESAKGTVRTYTLLITRIDSRSSDNTLKSLVARNVDLTPTFTKYTNEYYGAVANGVTKVEIAAEKSSNDATFVEGYGSRTVNLKVGENTILVKVKSETEAERTYTIIITRAGTPEVVVVDKSKSSNNNLESLVISSGNLMFNTDVLNYNLYVSNDITSVLVTPIVSDDTATVVVNSGASLQVGSNPIEVVVTAENGTTKTYTINIIRKEAGLAISSDSTLSTLQIRGEKISFSPINYLYTVVVFPGTDELIFNLEASNNKAQIEVIGNMELSDFTTVKVKVTAEDGSYSIYDVNVKVDSITVGEIVAFAVCATLVVGLIVYGTISRNQKKRENISNEKGLV